MLPRVVARGRDGARSCCRASPGTTSDRAEPRIAPRGAVSSCARFPCPSQLTTPRQGLVKRLGESTFPRLLPCCSPPSFRSCSSSRSCSRETASRSLSDTVRGGLRRRRTRWPPGSALRDRAADRRPRAGGRRPGVRPGAGRAGLRALVDVRGAFDVVQVLDPAAGASGPRAAPPPRSAARASAGSRRRLSGRPSVGDVERDGGRAAVDRRRARARLPRAADRRRGRRPRRHAPLSVRARREARRHRRRAAAGPQRSKLIVLSDGEPSDEAEMVSRGALRQRPDSESVARRAERAERLGEGEELRGRMAATGYAPVPDLGWAALVSQERGRGVRRRRRPAPGSRCSSCSSARSSRAVFALIFARRTTGPLRGAGRRAARRSRAATSRRASSPTGRPSSRTSAARSTRWSTASTRSSAQHRERQRASSRPRRPSCRRPPRSSRRPPRSRPRPRPRPRRRWRSSRAPRRRIADTVGARRPRRPATRATALEQADARHAGAPRERTLALAERVGEIAGAARADQRDRRPDEPARPQRRDRGGARRRGGRGLHASSPTRCAGWPSAPRRRPPTSPRSSTSTQDETNATVMAMEQSSKQMRRGLDADGRPWPTRPTRCASTTQQQGAATAAGRGRRWRR